MTTWVVIEGDAVRGDDAQVGALDRGLLLGDGIYETCLVVDGVPFAITRHLARLRRSAQLVGIEVPWSDSAVRSRCARAVAAVLADPDRAGEPGSGPGPGTGPGPGLIRLRITVTAGVGPLGPSRDGTRPTLVVAAGPAAARDGLARVAVVEGVRNPRSPTAGAKVTSSLDLVMALQGAIRSGADEAVVTTTDGFLAEGTTSNLFLMVDGALCTPGLGTGCLPGVTRELILEIDPSIVIRDDLRADDLRRASEAFLTSTSRAVQPIGWVDGIEIPGVPGPRTQAMAERFAQLQARSFDP